MSFSSLPIEIKQLVVLHIHEMDRKWRKLQAEIKAAGSSKVKNLTVQGIDTFSKVSRECRQLSLRYVLTTLKASKAQDAIFESSILGTPLADLITTFRIEHHITLESLSTIVQYILPRLPNLRRIRVPDYRPLSLLSPVNDGRAEPGWSQQPFVLRIFVGFVKQKITEWDVEVTPRIDLASLVLSSPSTLTSLTIRSNLRNHCYLLETADSPLASLLIKCTALATLKTVSRATAEPAHLVHPLVTSARYPCYHTLTTLSLSVGKDTSDYIDISALQFASEFQLLTHLHLEGPFAIRIPSGSSRYDMPQLLHLELNIDDLASVADVLKSVKLPRISCIDISFPEGSGSLAHEARQFPEFLCDIADELLGYSETLRHLTLESPVGLYQDDLDYLMTRLEDSSVVTEVNWRFGDAETRALPEHQLLDSDDDEVPSSSTLLEVVGESIRDTGEWIGRKATEIEHEGDLNGMRTLAAALKQVRELRIYSEAVRTYPGLQTSSCLRGPASAAIKEVSFTAATTEETLSFVLFHVYPRLPNLDSVRSEVDVHRRLLCPEQAAREPQREEMYQLNRDQFIQVAKSITNWTFRHSDYSLLAPYVEANCASVRSLDISSHSSHGRRLADNPIASLARLPPCPSLSSLSLGIHYHVSTSQSSAFTTDDLRFKYSFLPSLTSLTLAISSSYSQRGVVDSSVLRFASLFPALRSLRLEFEATNLEGADESFIFPRLFRLDLASPSFRGTTNILQHCDLPSIQHLGLLFPTQSEGITLEDDYKDLPALTAQIMRLRSTLGRIHYLTRSNSFYLAIIALRQNLADVWSEFSTVGTTSDIVVAGPRDNVNPKCERGRLEYGCVVDSGLGRMDDQSCDSAATGGKW
ncbi:hypothetical protein JCM5353_003863 [Sporobolomyces roseus]